jgi:predicted amidohydrolase YtcJ
MVSARTVKFFADGVIEAGTAAMLAPYTDRPHSCGLPVWDHDELAAAAAAFDADGFRLHIHAIGDAGVRNALDALEHVARVNGPSERRPVIAHSQLIDPADLPRFAQLGVIANVEPLWAQLDPLQLDLTMPRLGAARSTLQYPFGSLVATGAVLSMGSDWPVSSHRPLDGLAVAVTRQTSEGEPAQGWLPHERLAPQTALSAYTAGSAYQSFEEGRRGVLSVGARADLVWLGRDPLATPARDWPSITVRGTWLGGARTAGAAA